MKKLFQLWAVICLAAMPLAFVSCDDSKEDNGKGGGSDTLTFKVEVSVNGQEAVVNVTPSSNDDYYVVGNAATWMFEGDDAVADGIDAYAAMYVASLIDGDEDGWVETNSDTVGKGAKTVVFDGLAEDEYTAFVVGVNTADGTLTTEVATATFEIKAEVVELPELLTLTIGDYDAQSVSVDVTVDDEYTGWYMVAVYEAEWVDTFDSFEAFMAQQASVQQGNNLSGFALQGSQSGITCTTGDANTKYYVMAVGVNDDYELTTAVASAEFTTPEKDEQDPGPGGDDVKLNVPEPYVEGGIIMGDIYPSSDNFKYVVFCVPSNYFDPEEMGDYVYTIESAIAGYISGELGLEAEFHYGPYSYEFRDLDTNTYKLIVAALDDDNNILTYFENDYYVEGSDEIFRIGELDEDSNVLVEAGDDTYWKYLVVSVDEFTSIEWDFEDGHALVSGLIENGAVPSEKVYSGYATLSVGDELAAGKTILVVYECNPANGDVFVGSYATFSSLSGI